MTFLFVDEVSCVKKCGLCDFLGYIKCIIGNTTTRATVEFEKISTTILVIP